MAERKWRRALATVDPSWPPRWHLSFAAPRAPKQSCQVVWLRGDKRPPATVRAFYAHGAFMAAVGDCVYLFSSGKDAVHALGAAPGESPGAFVLFEGPVVDFQAPYILSNDGLYKVTPTNLVRQLVRRRFGPAATLWRMPDGAMYFCEYHAGAEIMMKPCERE